MIEGPRLSGVERLWLAADRVRGPFANRLLVEADSELSPDTVADSFEQLLGLSPALRARPGGFGPWTRWRYDSPVAPARRLSEPWDGLGPIGDPTWPSPIDPARGPLLALDLLPAGRWVLHAHHALLDGRGLLAAGAALAALSRGQTPDPLPFGVSDAELARRAGATAEAPVADDCGSPVAVGAPPSLGTTWARRALPAPGRSPLGPLVEALADTARARGVDRMRVDVPVDLRPHAPSPRSPRNLTGLVRLPDGELAALAPALAARAELGFVAAAEPLRWLPLGLLGWLGRRGALRAQARDRFSATGTISNLGRVDLRAYDTPGARARRVVVIPPGQPGLPALVTATGSREGLDLVLAMPASLAANGALERLMDALAAALTEA